jgi:hypothetical protein
MRYIARSDPIRAIGLLILAIAVILAIALSLHSSNATGIDPWRLAKEGAPTGLMAQVIQDNIQPETTVEAEQMKVWTIQQPHQTIPLYLIDTRVANAAEHPQDNPLCGAQGCVFLAYIPIGQNRYQRILSIYLNPHLPPKMTLLQPTAELKAGLPCLVARQLEQQKIRITQFCFNSGTYEIVETQRLPEVYE